MKRLCIVLGLLFVVVVAPGCKAPTEAQRKNAAALTDMAKEIAMQGVAPGTPFSIELVEAAAVNEEFVGSPKERLALPAKPPSEATPEDLAPVSDNRKQAKEDADAGGFWWSFTGGALEWLGLVLTVVGLPTAGVAVRKFSATVSAYKQKYEEAETKARDYAGHFDTVVKGLDSIVKKDKAKAAPVLAAIATKATDKGNKAEFDDAVDAVSTTSAG